MNINDHPLLKENKVMLVAGVYDVLSAKIAQRVGFPAVVLTGYGVSATYLGEPDFGLLTQTEALDVARRIVQGVDIAVTVDADTGYGGPLNVQRMVRELINIGAMGMILEDQRWPKRCGHMRGKDVINASEHAMKIRAAKDAAGNTPFIVTARTDAIATHGLDEAIRRARLYKEAGADILFVEAPRSKQDLERIGRELPPPLAVNMIEGGLTPMCSIEELYEMGFSIIGYVLTGLFAAAKALEKAFTALRIQGESSSIAKDLMSFEDFTSIIGLERRYQEDEKYKIKDKL
ncbi:MAG: isocitrate lyase/PEP mutase family protein [Deltaproteobacteria bacterium]|nr:isocitrate lyase/PEP mutase family protein [Deltaproteobacteria bacterium]